MKVRYNSELFRMEGFVDDQWNAVTIGSDITMLSLPKKIDRYRVEVSLACNLSCEYCVVHKNDVSQQNKMMDLETAKVIVNKFNEEVGERGSLFLMGGEPLTSCSLAFRFKNGFRHHRGCRLLHRCCRLRRCWMIRS